MTCRAKGQKGDAAEPESVEVRFHQLMVSTLSSCASAWLATLCQHEILNSNQHFFHLISWKLPVNGLLFCSQIDSWGLSSQAVAYPAPVLKTQRAIAVDAAR